MTNRTVQSGNAPVIDAEVRNELLNRARAAAEHAYVPYSDFPVGAAALSSDGSIHTGCNIENASYGLTICAERTAVSSAVSAGHRQIVAVAVSAPKVPRTSPCGACRQFLNEFRPAGPGMVVILDDRDGGEPVWLDGLLPHAFGPGNLDAAALSGAMSATSRRDDHGG
jgi:cytidine deaminase